MPVNTGLVSALQAAVPLEIASLAGSTFERRRMHVTGASQTIGEVADQMMFGGSQGRDAFAALVRSLAVLAYQPGGVTFDGVHFCADHQACRDAEAEADARLADEPGAGNTEVA